MSDTLRTKETVEEYERYRASGAMDNVCRLCEKTPVKEYKYWKIVNNDFPYDKVASHHDMIIPLRHVVEDDLTNEERVEYAEIKKELLDKYEYILEAGAKFKSIPAHHHLHLLVGK